MDYICAYCGKSFKPDPRVQNQRYCSQKNCQKARRTSWQRQKMAADPDYRENKERCQAQWQERNSDYYRLYRNKHPEYTQRNRFLQAIRDNRRRKDKQGKMLAKLDSLLKPYYSRKGAIFRLIPQPERLLAKLDSLTVKLVPIQAGSYRM
ncbi:MAG: hypothetical protein COZ89_00560 [Candidatus Nealsonbacteria bacterium CG_4_8_14_3_um_filter_37_23]|nr:MAG: hypothetical protein COZ89_00560 [Candidatus Nealsonbacteria bacterium CG_4_8_14_3_um_filter_37_23]